MTGKWESEVVNHEYDYKQNWKTFSPVTNQSKLWQNLRKKLDIDYTFSEKKRNTQNNLAKCTTIAHVNNADCKAMTCQMSYYTVQLQA